MGEEQEKSLFQYEEERLQDILNQVPGGIAVTRMEQGVLGAFFLNASLKKQLHIQTDEKQQIMDDYFFSCVKKEDRDKFLLELQDFLNDKAELDGVYRFLDLRSGNYRWYQVSGRIEKEQGARSTVFLSFTNVDQLKRAEEEQQRGKAVYEEAIKAAHLVTWEYDIQGHFIRMTDNAETKRARRKLGLQRIIDDAPVFLAEAVEDHDKEKFLEMYRKVEQGKDASCIVWIKQTQEREAHCEHISYAVSFDEKGNPSIAYGTAQDITEQKKEEEQYREEIKNIREKSERNLIAKSQSNLTQNILLSYYYENEAAAELEVGTSYDMCVREMSKLAVTEQERCRCEEFFDRQNLIRLCNADKKTLRFQYQRCKKGGKPAWILFVVNIFKTPHSKDVECFIYTYDITKQVRSEKIMELIALTEFDMMGVLYTRTGLFELINKSDEIKFGEINKQVPYQDCISYVKENFLRKEDWEQYESDASIGRILEGLQENGRYSATYCRREGDQISCKQTDCVWLDEPNGEVLIMRTDVTPAYERDGQQIAAINAAKLEADRANEAKSVFLSSMSHDLRTTLNGILGFTEIALKEQNHQKRQEYLMKIQSSGKLLLDMVNDTLELSRIESGKMVLEPENLVSREILENVITALRPSAEAKLIQLVVEENFPKDEVIRTDRLKLQKVVLNLLSNAIKYTHAGGIVKITFSTYEKAVNGCNHFIAVEDNGIGMSKEFLSRAFEPFSQENRPEAVNAVGTGLGLTIVKRIVDMMGGNITVESEEGKGTKFVVNLPIEIVPESGTLQETAARKDYSMLVGKHILLCEDNYLNIEIATILLHEKGIVLTVAKNGAEGVEIFRSSRQGSFDAILMDIRMPMMDGYEATAKIRSLPREDAEKIPIIAMTADAFEEDMQRAKELGMNAYLTKPVDPEQVYATLFQVICGCCIPKKSIV